MAQIQNYLNDEANWQAQAVLAYLRIMSNSILDNTYDERIHRPTGSIEVGRYENYREQGYVFSLRYKGNQKNYAVYEHRNSDDICILISHAKTLNTPNFNEVWADKGKTSTKYDYDRSFEFGQIVNCAEWIAADMRQEIDKWIKEKKSETTER